MLLVLITIIYTPFHVAFFYGNSEASLLVFEVVCDLFFLFDIFVTFLTPYERNDGSLECNIKKIATHYSLNNLLWDLIAIMPTEFAELSNWSSTAETSYT